MSEDRVVQIARHAAKGGVSLHDAGGLLGPVVHKYLLALDQYIRYLDDGQTSFLFMSRAGVHIHELYSIYLNARGLAMPAAAQMFWASRLSVCKGAFQRSELARRTLAKEFQHTPVSMVVSSLLRQFPEVLETLNLDRPEHKAHGHVFPGWVDGPTPEARRMREFLGEWGQALDEYIGELAGANSRLVIVDSGWQGTSQQILKQVYPDYDWLGLYLGRIGFNAAEGSTLASIIGLLFESDRYVPSNPASAIILHRHLIENLFESDGDSIEEIPAGFSKDAADRLIASHTVDRSQPSTEGGLYEEVVQYIKLHAAEPVSRTMAAYEGVAEAFAKALAFPTRSQALSFSGKERSADFGRADRVPVLVTPCEQTSVDQRIGRSLWPAGQIAIEFPEHEATARQKNLLSTNAAAYFDPLSGSTDHDRSAMGCVGIITRTKDRPLLLARAAESVSSQIYKNYKWIVVNDGGSEEAARSVIEKSCVDPTRILLVSNKTSQGMERASNIGISHADVDFLIIHDDDDSWEPNFLRRTVEFLSSPEGLRYGGVITQTTYVSEEIDGDEVIIHSRTPYMDWVRSIQIPEMASGNLFPPISFLFRRSEYDRIGGFNERLPVLGDWFFNLEFLLEADIAVMLEPLANYHHRDRPSSSSAYSNSVIGGRSKHEEFNAVMRNEFMRRNGGHPAATALLSAGYLLAEVRNQGAQVRSMLAESASSRPAIADKNSSKLYTQWIAHHLNEERLRKASGFKLALRKFSLIDSATPPSRLSFLIRKYNIQIPIPDFFDEGMYLQLHPDVADAVKSGAVVSGFMHYATYGLIEGRMLQ